MDIGSIRPSELLSEHKSAVGAVSRVARQGLVSKSQGVKAFKPERERLFAVSVPMNTESMEDYLVLIATKRDRGAFKKLFAAFAPKIKSFAMRNGVGPELAEEVVQETFIRVWRKAEQFDPGKASASTWLYTIARNQRIDLLRKRHRPEPDFEDPAFVPEPEPQPSDVISRSEEALRLRQCMESLSPEQQEVLKLSFMEELPHVEVAERLGIPLGTVKSRIRLAMKHIRSEIGDIR
jgi:RNA polymerase sigma-70 factor (ECF subfamily)